MPKALGARNPPTAWPRADTGEARSATARFLWPVLARVRAAIDRVNERARQRRAQHHLRDLPDYLLRDIGIDRPEIAFAARFGRFAVRRDGDLER